MKSGPLNYESDRARRQPTSENGQIMYINQGLRVPVLCVKMWGIVVFKEHPDHDAEEATDLRHGLPHVSAPGKRLLPSFLSP